MRNRLELHTASPGSEENRIRRRLRKDLRFLTLFLLPFSEDFRDDTGWIAHRLGIDAAAVTEMRADLFRAGLWVREESGKIRPRETKNPLGDDGSAALSSAQYLTMSTEIISRVDPCAPSTWGEVHTVVTSHALQQEFVSKVKGALADLLEKSAAAPGETVFSWAHAFIDTLEALNRETTP